ncbi:MAG: hypothetical protein ACP5LQ_03710 [Candidatus Methanodesulfokora sp.]
MSAGGAGMKKGAALLIALLLLPGLLTARAASTPMPIIVNEYINATIVTDGSGHYYCGPWNYTGYITVLNNNTGETISDIWLPVYVPPGVSISVLLSPSYATVVQGTPPSYVSADNPAANAYWHITQLRSGDNVVLKYTYTGTGCPLLLVNETYSPYKIVNGQQSTVNVNISVKNDFSFKLGVKIKKILPAGNGKEGWANTTGNPIFTSAGTATVGGTGLSTDKKELYWTKTGAWPDDWFFLNAGATGMIKNAQIQGTPDLSEVGGATTKIPLGTIYVYFYANQTFTGLKIGKVFAVGNANVEVKKEQGTSKPDTWNETLVFYDTSGVFKYDLFNTTLWATEGDNPSSDIISDSVNKTYRFNITQLMPGGSFTTTPKNFTYSGVPKIWGLAKFRISNDQNKGWWNYTNATVATDSSGLSYYRVIEEIWAVNGYLVKARKEIRASATAGCYVIGLTLSNIGGWMSPYVEMYDVVPSGFSPSPSGTEGNMVFKPLEMLAADANPASPPDYSLITSPAGYEKGYVWKSYPLPAPQLGFAEYFKGTGSGNNKTITVTLADGTTRQWTVYPVDASKINVNGTTYTEGETFTAGGTTFKVVWVDDNLTAGGGGYVVVSAKGYYQNLKMDVFNPVFVKYAVCGSGNYNATNLFIVGVDPRNTLDALAVSAPETKVSYGTSNFELIFVIAAVAASIILVRKR